MRYFTLQEANKFVPALRAAFAEIERDRFALVRLLKEAQAEGRPFELDEELVPEDLPEPERRRRQKARQLMGRIREIVGDLTAHGLLVKGLDGLVDFRSKRANRAVYLCWRKGEERIQSWHEMTAGADGRQPLDGLFDKPPLPN